MNFNRIKEFFLAKKENAPLAESLSVEGFDFFWKGKYADAEICFLKSLAWNSKNPRALSGMARIFRMKGHLKKALKCSEQSLLQMSQDVYALDLHAKILRDLKKLNQCVFFLKKILELTSDPEMKKVTLLWILFIDSVFKNNLNAADLEIKKLPTLFSCDSWEPYRLAWWYFENTGRHELAQSVGLGALVKNLGTEHFVQNENQHRFSKSKSSLSNHEEIIFQKSDNPLLVTLKNSSCYHWNFGTAFMSDNKVLTDLSENDGSLAALHSQIPEAKYFKGTILSLAYPFGSGFFHFLLDTLPALIAAKKSNSFKEIDYFFLEQKIEYQTEILKLFGISEENIIYAKNHPHVQADQICMVKNCTTTYPHFELRDWVTLQLREALIKHAQPPQKPFPKRFYIQRGANLNGRGLQNESEVVALLETKGFSILRPEEFDYFQQIHLFKEAEFIVGLAGSAFVNSIFMSPSSKALIIYPPNSVWRSYASITRFLNVHHIAHFANSVASEWNPDPDWMKIDANANLEVNMNEFKKLLNSVL